jgi:hypothetical protein
MGDNTNLKKFHTTLDRVGRMGQKIQMINDCENSQTPFLETATCFSLDNGKVKHMGSDYAKFPDSAYGILHNIKNADQSTFSYNDLYDSAVLDGYNGTASMFDVYEQDVVDLSGALHDENRFNDDLQQKYKSVRSLRDELDNKMREIYNPEFQDSNISHEQSIYLTLSWTIVATSVLYYLFVKL